MGRGNKLCFLKGYGYRQFYPEKETITLDTLFDLASVTKVACTATALAAVIDQGKVSPGGLVVKYFPEFGANGKDRITVWHCMTHTSGIMDCYNQTKGTRQELWNLLCGLGLQYPVGERFDYKDNNTLMFGQTLQSAADNGLKYYLIDRPNTLARRQIELADLVDKYKPFRSYARLARRQGLSFGQLARMINRDQMLGVEIFEFGGAH
ncbi:MAG: serine hydrolase [Thermoguttaceae bacterium]